MNSKEILKALDRVDSVFISVRLVEGGPPTIIRWKDKSLALRRKIRAQVSVAVKENPDARFNARVIDNNLDKIILVGDSA